MHVGRMHLDEFPHLVPFLLQDFNNILPRVLTFQLFSTLLGERGQFDEAIRVCESAIGYGLHDGTKRGYQGRIERIRKQQERRERAG